MMNHLYSFNFQISQIVPLLFFGRSSSLRARRDVSVYLLASSSPLSRPPPFCPHNTTANRGPSPYLTSYFLEYIRRPAFESTVTTSWSKSVLCLIDLFFKSWHQKEEGAAPLPSYTRKVSFLSLLLAPKLTHGMTCIQALGFTHRAENHIAWLMFIRSKSTNSNASFRGYLLHLLCWLRSCLLAIPRTYNATSTNESSDAG
jgi:hypothetical protein